MKPELKQKWIDALRSGKYRQGRDRLKGRNGAMCCLGVLCEIADAEWTFQNGRYFANGVEDNFLPRRIASNAGLARAKQVLLAEMNDGESGYSRHNFCEIADYIEKNL